MLRASAVAFIGFSAGLEARADLIVGNLSGAGAIGMGMGPSTVRYASSFVLDPSFAPMTIDAVRARFQARVHEASVRLWLFTDGGGVPSSEIISFTPSTVRIGDFAAYAFAPESPVVLQPDTAYWVVAGVEPGPLTIVRWSLAFSFPPARDAGSNPAAHIQQVALGSDDSGSTWRSMGGSPAAFAVEGTPVPGPGGAVALVAAGSLAGSIRRRLKSSD
ncbi:hypothetical protein PHYC_03409 [Phycisphaerales bacterium]|nr:hypothetical protein PHYC_03409 [Phycisphaerales bacterium]